MSFRKFQESAGARRGVQVVLGLIVLIFLVGAFWSFGSAPQFMRRRSDRVALTVNGQRIMSVQLWQTVDNLKSRGGSDVSMTYGNIAYAMEQITAQVVTSQEAARLSIHPTDAEVAAKRDEFVANQLEAPGKTKTERANFFVQNDTTEQLYEDEVRKRARDMRDYFRQAIIQEKLVQAIGSSLNVSDNELLATYSKFTISEIYIKVPSEGEIAQWEENSPPPTESSPPGKPRPEEPRWLHRSDADAQALADEVRGKINAGGSNWAELAEEYSDSPVSASGGGVRKDIAGASLRSSYPPEVRDAIYEAKTGAVSDPIKTDSGYYIIRVDEVKTDSVPPDFQQTKEKTRETDLKQKQSEAFANHMRTVAKAAVVDVADDEPRAQIAWLIWHNSGDRPLSEEKVARADAVDRLLKLIDKERRDAQAQTRRDEQATYEFLAPDYYQLGVLYRDDKKWELALEAFQEGVICNSVDEIKIEVARCLVELGRKDEALPIMKDISLSATPVAKFLAIHNDLSMMYARLGDMKLATEEMQKVQEAQQQTGGYGGFPGGMNLDLGGM